MSLLTLAEIWIYPVKSLGGIRLPEAIALNKGLAYDRRWMLINKAGEFLTQRILPQLALFHLTMGEQFLHIRFDNEKLAVSKSQNVGPPLRATVWNDTVTVAAVSEAADRWFSQQLQQPVRLVQFPEDSPRPVDSTYAPADTHVSLADGYPYLVIGEASLRDLNTRLKSPVPMNRFRPNFVVAGSMPYEEDNWKNFRIGGALFAGIKPCARCVMTTVNQQTAERGTEPLATLAGYRKKNGKVYFGQNALAAATGIVHEGDKIDLI
jgi:uncharacterized protein YcbX